MLILWHQRDLRIEHNLALSEAQKVDNKIIPLFIFSPKLNLGPVSTWWLKSSLNELKKEYSKRGITLLFKKGPVVATLKTLLEKTGASAIYFNQTFEKEELKVKQTFKEKACPFNGNFLVNLPEIKNKSGKPFLVFTPFYNNVKKDIQLPKTRLQKFGKIPKISSDSLSSLSTVKCSHGVKKFWTPGRAEALRKLRSFKSNAYHLKRDIPSIRGTSFLSPHLHFGEISPAEVWKSAKSELFRRQLIWREFSTAFIYHFPKTPNENWNKKFDRFNWLSPKGRLKKWQEGKTGYPIIDASMKQLLQIGWMHNRLRMVVASFLVKDLLVDWRKGAKWFWEKLVDADLGNNTFGWQWASGCGMDAAPYFRIFNPTLQGKKFDSDGKFVKEYCPELKKLPSKWIHCPWEAPEEILEEAEVILGKTYPYPIVDHGAAREKALKIYKRIK